MNQLLHLRNRRTQLCRLTTPVFFGIALVASLGTETHAIATTVTPVSIKIPYGETRIPGGARLEVVSSDSATVRVRYLGEVYTVPIQSVTILRLRPRLNVVNAINQAIIRRG